MSAWAELKTLTRSQRNAVFASFLGWTLDAFDFFILVWVVSNIAADFNTKVSAVSEGIEWTLLMRPVGAFVFGYLADKFGRRPVLMFDIVLFSVIELASAFAPDLTTLIILRGAFGVAMGGEWGVGSSLVMESIPPETRGAVSGLLQEGYAVGNLMAGGVYYLIYSYFPQYGWRAMFVVGAIPALLAIYVRSGVEESPTWEKKESSGALMFRSLIANWRMALYVVLLMSCFNAFSHGTQDLYKTFLSVQLQLPKGWVTLIPTIANIGAILGGVTFGILSERMGRRQAIVGAALLALPIIPLWAYSTNIALLALGGFLMQISVQGAWGVVPAHLNELSPGAMRGTFPGFMYQMGNAVIAQLAPFQSRLAEARGNDYSFALATTTAFVALLLSVVVWFGPERKGMVLTTTD